VTTNIWNTPTPDPHYEVNQSLRSEWFSVIAPIHNWKDPIDCWIQKNQFNDCNQAAIFFTGAPIEIVERSYNMIRVVGAGYYATIGA
jgi:hypothetical protein